MLCFDPPFSSRRLVFRDMHFVCEKYTSTDAPKLRVREFWMNALGVVLGYFLLCVSFANVHSFLSQAARLRSTGTLKAEHAADERGHLLTQHSEYARSSSMEALNFVDTSVRTYIWTSNHTTDEGIFRFARENPT